jgi:hypothetical protein
VPGMVTRFPPVQSTDEPGRSLRLVAAKR